MCLFLIKKKKSISIILTISAVGRGSGVFDGVRVQYNIKII